MKVFLGGTWNNSNWRDKLIPELEKNNIKYFNPIVKNWTQEHIAIENLEKNNLCDILLYMITPEQKGFYSFAEIIDSAVFSNKLVIFAYSKEGWEGDSYKSLQAIENLLLESRYSNCVTICKNTEKEVLERIIVIINSVNI